MVTLENDAVGAALPLVGVHRVVVVTHERSNPIPVQRQIAPAALLHQRCLHRPAKRLVAVASQTLGEFAQAVEQPRRKQVGPCRFSMGRHKIRALLLAGIRSARLWRQLGGHRWQLVISRRKLLKELYPMLRGN